MSTRTSEIPRNGSAIAWILLWLAGMAIIAWGGSSFAIPRVEQKLQEDVENSIDNSQVDVTVQGLTVTLAGPIPDDKSRETLLNAARDTLGVRTVHDQLIITAVSDITTLTDNSSSAKSATKEAPVTLPESTLPPENLGSDADSNTIARNDLPAEAEPVDQNRPEDGLEDGSVGRLTITDPSSTPLEIEATELPSLSLRVLGGVLAVEGRMSPDDDAAKLIRDTMSVFELDVVSNGIQFNDTVMKAEWLDSLQSVLPTMQTLEKPQVDVQERQITLSGQAKDLQTQESIVGEALAALGEFSLIERISVRESTPAEPATPAEPVTPTEPAPNQTDALEQALAELPSLRILFDSKDNALTSESLDILDQIATVLNRFPNSRVAIEGHTDSSGDIEQNLRLSLLRATTVRDYLTERGVSVYNLRALGYGEEKPIADNDTAEGRATNRRIEFTF